MEFCVILFHSTNHAIWAADIIKKGGFGCRMIPVPRHLSSECGYSVRIECADMTQVGELLGSAGVSFDRMEPL